MKKNNMIFMLCIFSISLQTMCVPSFGRKKKGSLTRSDTPAAGALFSAQTRSQSELPSTDHSCSGYSRTCAAAVAQVHAEKAEIETLLEKCTALRDETAIAQRAALASANQAAASQAQTQNMTAVVIAIGAYCMYTHMKKKKKNKPDSLKTYYRKIYQHFSQKVRTVKRSQKQLRSFCVNCLPNTIKSYF